MAAREWAGGPADPPWLVETDFGFGAPTFLWEAVIRELGSGAARALLADRAALRQALIAQWRTLRSTLIAQEWSV